jgi:hypothetical protein
MNRKTTGASSPGASRRRPLAWTYRRRLPRTLCALGVLAALGLAALTLSSCDLGSGPAAIVDVEGSLPGALVGEWSSWSGNRRLDGYTITADTLSYDDGSGGEFLFSYAGTIQYVANFSATAGIIIIKYTTLPQWEDLADRPYFGVYYRNLKADSVQLANAINPDKSAPETATLEEAIAKFTRHREGDFVSWGVVTPQRKQR